MISVRVLCLFHNKVYLYRLHMLGSSDLCEGLRSVSLQGLFVPFAYAQDLMISYVRIQ